MAEGRNFVGIDMSPLYFNFAKDRIEGAAVQHNARRMVVDPEEPTPVQTPASSSL
jgi:DNA modification methylase